MRSMRSLAHISNWSQLKINQANAQGSVKTESSKDQPKEMLKAEMEDKRKDKSKCKRAKPDTLAIWVVSGSNFEAVALSSSLETRNSKLAHLHHGRVQLQERMWSDTKARRAQEVPARSGHQLAIDPPLETLRSNVLLGPPFRSPSCPPSTTPFLVVLLPVHSRPIACPPESRGSRSSARFKTP
jgi:hypothetical protein